MTTYSLRQAIGNRTDGTVLREKWFSCTIIFFLYRYLHTIVMRYFFPIVVFFLSTSVSVAQTPTGTLKGRVLNQATKAPLTGVTITLTNTQQGAVSNEQGEFSIANVPVGAYTIQLRLIGYAPLTEPDVIVRSSRITFVEKELSESAVALEEITVHSGYFRSALATPASTIEMGAEELRRAPGSAGDVNRALFALPSVVQAEDEANDLIVRGGAPFENGYYIDNIFTPNINHFPQQGASGGGLAMLNIDFIQEVSMLVGGFDASYGNRISSIVDLKLRDGNRDTYDAQIDMNLTGFGGTIEGPLSSSGSFMLSAKHSYFDVLAKIIDTDEEAIPSFYDIQGKVVYDITPQHRLTLLDVFGQDHQERTREQAIKAEEKTLGEEQYTQHTLGANWRALWGESGYSNTAFSYATNKAYGKWSSVATGEQAAFHSSTENFYTLRNHSSFQLDPNCTFDIGTEWQYHSINGALSSGAQEPAFALNETTGAVFATLKQSLWETLSVALGVRTAYFSASDAVRIEPRINITYAPSASWSCYAAYGVVHQTLPLFFSAYTRENSSAVLPKANHYLLGTHYQLSNDTRIVLEGYAKEYSGFPLDPDNPTKFVVDDIVGDDGTYGNYRTLLSTGEAYTRGVELLVQKKLANHFYGIAGASYFRSKYRDATGTWRNRLFDNRAVVTISAGWKPNDNWEVSARWVYSGGKAYTPIHTEQSQQQGKLVLDTTRIMDAQYPAYHSLNVRVDKRFYFTNSNLILYLSILNAYSRENIVSYDWDTTKNALKTNKMFSLIPILGVEYEF